MLAASDRLSRSEDEEYPPATAQVASIPWSDRARSHRSRSAGDNRFRRPGGLVGREGGKAQEEEQKRHQLGLGG